MTAFNKTWIASTASSWATVTNWGKISVRNSGYTWTASGSGTNEYYLRAAGNVDPGFGATPGKVYINGVDSTEGTAGSLTAGQWDYADNDTLGYSTIYVRLSDGTDPDSKALDYVQFQQIPVATDHVRIPAGTGGITSGLDQSAVALGDFIVEAGFANALGTSTAPLRIDPDRFIFEGSGTAYIDIGSAAISPEIRTTASASTGTRGLYLTGSAIATLNVLGGAVGLAWRSGETSTVTTVRVNGTNASVWLGSGVTVTTTQTLAGSLVMACAGTTLECFGGTTTTQGNGAWTTANVYQGTFYSDSTGTLTTLNAYGGTTEFRGQAARTLTNLNQHPSIEGTAVVYNPDVLTITNRNAPGEPARIIAYRNAA